MLTNLHVQNYALISKLEIELEKGFYVLTGETGAGKSILLGALSLLLGQRADVKSIKPDAEKCIVEGVFDISAYQLLPFFKENDIDYYAQCSLRREIHVSGKSRAFINDTPVSLNALKELGTSLIDIHSQHQNLLLADNNFQLDVLDVLAKHQVALDEYKHHYSAYKSMQTQLANLIENAERNKADEEYFRFQYNQLHEAKLKADEQEELEEELKVLTHAEEIKSGLYKIIQLLDADDMCILNSLKEATNIASSLTKIYSSSEESHKRLESCYIELKDLADELETRSEKIDFSPERLEQLNERLNLIYSLQQKHRVQSVAELLDIEKNLREKLDATEHSDEEIQALRQQIDEQLKKCLSIAERISSERKKAAKLLENNLIDRLGYLGMPNINFQVEFKRAEQPTSTGIDTIQFLFSANKKMPLQPVSQIASGGEISRLMLCIKALIAGAASLPTIIFDEIDTGVSGEIADKMGSIMLEMSQNMQVISITHLPQIAARGNGHFKVYKEDVNGKTTTNIKKLTQEERVLELAQMLSGAEITEAAISNAKALLKVKR